MTDDSRKASAKIVNLDQVRQARQRANELRELNDYEMELIGTLLDRRLFIRALETSAGLPDRLVPFVRTMEELIDLYCDLIEAGGDKFDDACMEIERFCDLITGLEPPGINGS